MIECESRPRLGECSFATSEEFNLGRKKKLKAGSVNSMRENAEADAPDEKDVALAESRSADAATVGWTLAAMGTLGALAFRWIIQLIISSTPDAKSLPEATPFIPGLMHFTALVSGILAVSMTPFVYWLRRTSPPLPITLGIVIIGLAPLILLALNW